MKKGFVFCLMVLFAGGMFLSVPAAAKDDALIGVTTGKRKVINHNIQGAKKQAVDDALKTALQNAFASLVSREVFAANLDFFYEQILSKTSDYIQAYRVLGGMESKGYYLVGVETKVDRTQLEKKLTDARILKAGKDKPTILFFIAEKTMDDLDPKYWWAQNPVPYVSDAEQIIVSQMLEDAYHVTGNGPDRPDPSFYNIDFESVWDVSAARNLGAQMKADMIVIGKASSVEAINRMGEERTFDAIVRLEAWHLETGEKAVSVQAKAAAKSQVPIIGHTSAIKNAAEVAATDLSTKVGTYWTEQLRKEHAFDVRIEGSSFLPRFIALKQRIMQMPGIENMQPREMGSDFALLEVFYKGKPSQFADTVMLKTFEDFGLEIMDVTDNLITIRFIEKQEPSLFEDNPPVSPDSEAGQVPPVQAQEESE